jgi:hypothetical protein
MEEVRVPLSSRRRVKHKSRKADVSSKAAEGLEDRAKVSKDMTEPGL